MYTLEKQHVSLMYIMYASATYNTSFYTHISPYVVWRIHPLGNHSWASIAFKKCEFSIIWFSCSPTSVDQIVLH